MQISPFHMHTVVHMHHCSTGAGLFSFQIRWTKCPKEKYSRSSVEKVTLLNTLPVSTPGTRVLLNIRSYWDEHMGIVFWSMS